MYKNHNVLLNVNIDDDNDIDDDDPVDRPDKIHLSVLLVIETSPISKLFKDKPISLINNVK